MTDPDREVDCHGGFEYGKRFFRCTGVHRKVNLHSAIVQSCNTYFYELGSRVSIDRLAAIGLDFGFGVKTGIGVNPEARGRMPTRSWYTRRYKEAFRGGFTLLSAIGQGATTVSVLQLALSYAALANGGTLYQPQVVRSIETSDGTVVQDFPPRVRRMVELDQDHLAMVKNALDRRRRREDGHRVQGAHSGTRRGGQDRHGAGEPRHAARRRPGQGLVLQPRSRLVRRLRALEIPGNRDRRDHRARRRRRQERRAGRHARRARLGEAEGEARLRADSRASRR